MARDLTNAYLATPNQASTAFGVGGAHPIKQKSLFVMRFLRSPGEGGEEWKNGLSFLVKSIDRPTVQPIVEELNQYNKKRIIHTGVKYTPVTCVLYDTADGAAMSMWVQYAQYYFGDYRQDSSSYADDIISPKMLGTTGLSTNGYGFGINNPTSGAVDGINTQFFYNRIEIYQVWGGEYTCFQLLNPRINNFDPDDLDYENSGPSMITMSLNYEAIFHENGGKPQKISQNSTLTEFFGGVWDGEVFEPSPSATRTTSFDSVPNADSSILTNNALQSLLGNNTNISYVPSDRSDTTTSSGGALSQYGNFDFGDFSSLGSSLPSELSFLAGSKGTDIGSLGDPFPAWITTTKAANELELARIKQSQSANADALNSVLGTNASSLNDISQGIGEASLLSGTSPQDQVDYDNSYSFGQEDDGLTWAFPAPSLGFQGDPLPAPASTSAVVTNIADKDKTGLSLSPLVLATVNTNSDGRSQIGQRKNSNMNPLLAYIFEPKPSTTITPDIIFGKCISAVGIALTGQVVISPIPISATLEVVLSISSAISAYTTVSGTVNGTIIVNSQTAGLISVSGIVSTQVNISGSGTAVCAVVAMSNPSQGISRPIPVIVGARLLCGVCPTGILNSPLPISSHIFAHYDPPISS